MSTFFSSSGSHAPSAPSVPTTKFYDTFFNTHAAPTQKTGTIKPISAIGGAAPQQTGVSAMPTVNSQLQFSQPQAFSAPKVNAGNPNPLDAQYFTDIGKLQTYFNTQTADINAAIAQAQANYDLSQKGIQQSADQATQSEANVERDIGNALDVLAHNQPIDLQNQANANNKAGLAVSGYGNRAIGNINFQYDTKRTGLNNQLSDAKQQLTNAIARLNLQSQGDTQNLAAALAGYQRQLGSLNANYGLDAQQALLNTIARAQAADASAAQNMSFGSPGASSGVQSIPYTSPSGVKGMLHIYPDGRKVFVKGAGPNGIINRI